MEAEAENSQLAASPAPENPAADTAAEKQPTELAESTEATLGPTEIAMCDSCYNSAIELEGDKGDESAMKCDVCELRRQLAESREQVAELEARLAKFEQTKQADVAAEEAAADARPHFMAIYDGIFAKLRKYPYNMFLQIGRAPRSFWRTKASGGIEEMASHLLDGFDRDRVEGRGFHTLWFGGLTDTTKEDYERAAYITKLQELLAKIRDHKKCLSVSWATLPETAFNAEAREINERMADWATNTPWIRLLDLRYISRREGTMETKEAIWTQKGCQLVAESLKKFLSEKLDLTDDELKSMEASAKEMQVMKAKKQSQLDEQKLRKQQKLAKAALLKAGHPVPGSGAQPQGRKRGGKARGSGPPSKKFVSHGATNNSHKFANGSGAPRNGGQNGNSRPARHAPAPFNKAAPFLAGRAPEFIGGGATSAVSRLPASSNRVNPDYLDDTRAKRPRYSEPAYETRTQFSRYPESSPMRFEARGPLGGGAPYGDVGLYNRRDDLYRMSSPRGGFASDPLGASMAPAEVPGIYERVYGSSDGAYQQNGRRQQQQQQWESYDRVARR